MIIFTLTEEHIKLLNRMYVEFYDHSYNGAPSINMKRPYGNSGVVSDIAEILDIDLSEYEENDEDIPDDLYANLIDLHRQTATALQIVLCTKSFVPGTYRRTASYDALSWVLVA